MEISVKRDGLVLRGILEKPEAEKCPVVIMYHGFTGDLGYESSSMFAVLAKMLKEKGIASVRFDFNGHGKSDGAFTEMNMFNELLDAEKILRYVKELDFTEKVYLLGHSQGGVIAGMLAGYYHDQVEKLVMLAPAAVLKDDALEGVCMGASYDPGKIPDTVDVGRGFVVGGYYFRIAQTLPVFEVTSKYQKKTLLIHGTKDSIVDPKSSLRYEKCLGENCILDYIEGLDHDLAGKRKTEVFEKTIAFLTE